MPYLGMRSTYDLVDGERPKEWRLGIMEQFPDAAPLCHVIFRAGKESSSDPEFSWWERGYDPKELITHAGDAPGQITLGSQTYADTLHVEGTGADYCRKGTVLLNARTMERVAVTADPSDSTHLDIRRGIGDADSTVEAAWAHDDVLVVIGTAFAEGADVPKAIAWDPVKFHNFTQILRTSCDYTRTASKTRLRTEQLKNRAKKETLKDHMIDLERAFLFGRPYEVGAAGDITRYTGGIFYFCEGGLEYDFSLGLTRKLWRELQYDLSQGGGSDEVLLLAGSTMIMCLEEMAEDSGLVMQEVAKTDTFGMRMKKWVNSLGQTILVKEHAQFSRSAEFHDSGIIVDPAELYFRYVDDTEFLPNRQDPGSDKVVGEYLTEAGLEVHFGLTRFAAIRNCSTYRT